MCVCGSFLYQFLIKSVISMQTKGLGYIVPAGRRDGRISQASDTFTNLPPPSFNVDQLSKLFANKSFTQEEMVTLSGINNSDLNSSL